MASYSQELSLDMVARKAHDAALAALRPSAEEHARIEARCCAGETLASIAGEIGVGRKLLSKWHNAWRRRCPDAGMAAEGSGDEAPSASELSAAIDGPVVKQGSAPGGYFVDVTSQDVRTLDQLLEVCQADLSRWAVTKWVANKWGVATKSPDGTITMTPIWQVKAWFGDAPGAGAAGDVVERLIARMDAHSPNYAPVRRLGKPRGRFAVEIAIPDAHVGMLASILETGEGYDLELARKAWEGVMDDLLTQTGHLDVEEYWLVLGHDFFHFDRPINGQSGGQTSKGTPLDVACRFADMFEWGHEMCVQAIDRLRQRARVKVIMVGGNHDAQATFCLGRSLKSWYRLDSEVTIDNGITQRKFMEWGVNLIGFTHGSEEPLGRLPQIMANEQKEAWARTTHHEWHTGDKHAKKDLMTVALTEVDKVRIRIIPSIAARDAWHAGKGYDHIRAAEAYAWNRDTGFAGMWSAPVRPPE